MENGRSMFGAISEKLGRNSALNPKLKFIWQLFTEL